MAASKYWRLKKTAAGIIATGGTRWDAAKACGVDPATIFRWLQKPDFQAAIEAATPGAVEPEPEPIKPERKQAHTTPAIRKARAARDKRILELNPGWPANWLQEDPRRFLFAEAQTETDSDLRELWANWMRAVTACSHGNK